MARRKAKTPDDIADIIKMGTETVARELSKLEELSGSSEDPLPTEEAQKLVRYVQAAVFIAKDSRDATIKGDLSNLTDAELERLAASGG